MTNTWLSEIWKYRELFYFFVWRDIKVKYKQSLIGIGWAVIQPLFTMIVFTLFFGRLAEVPSEGYPYPVFSYAALLPWTFFSGAIMMAGSSLVSNAGMLNKVYFPRVTLPISSVLSGVLDFAIASLLLLFLLWFYEVPPTWRLLLMAPLLAALVALASGVGMFVAAVHVRYRDVKYALPFLVQIWMFMTPVIYPVSMIPEQYRPYLALNPLAGIIDAFRASVLPTKVLDLPLLGMSLAATVVVFVGGALYFRRTERWFADVI
jgi:lipopolysaccharide transport system permease protein